MNNNERQRESYIFIHMLPNDQDPKHISKIQEKAKIWARNLLTQIVNRLQLITIKYILSGVIG